MKFYFGLFPLLFLACASTLEKPLPKPTLHTEHVWQGIKKVAFAYPIHDFSSEEGYVESDWITLDKKNRYRFFIQNASHKIGEFFIDVEQQRRISNIAPWLTIKPYENLEENLRIAIRNEIQNLFQSTQKGSYDS